MHEATVWPRATCGTEAPGGLYHHLIMGQLSMGREGA